MMTVKKNILIPSTNKIEINVDIFADFETRKTKLPLLIFSHGFKGFKDWGGFPYMLERLSEQECIAVSYNFTHNGVSQSTPTEFTRLDLFAENTITKELEDLTTVIDYFYDKAEMYGINKDMIMLIGHSRGGGTSIIKASEDRRIKALVTLASVSSFDRYSEKQKALWLEKGYLEIPNQRTGQIMRMNKTYLDDIEKNAARFDLCKAVSSLVIPFLIIHGAEDLSVKYTEAETLYNCSGKELTKLEIIENTGHTFGTEHPFKGTTHAFDKVISLIVSFMRKHFSNE